MERIVATFFADDTTVYLSKEDDFGDLEQILKEWCLASGAKFNISKTEAIPLGSPEYRETLRQKRFLNGEDGTQIPEHIKIAREGEAIRSLGALIGNDINQLLPWSRVLERIDKSLDRWEKSRPTMEGRRLIISMIIGGMTQYLTKVQGMPKEVELRLEKRIRDFLWDDKTHVCINKETMYAPIDMGGRNLLDIVARNEAIMVTWLQSYLDISENRATWTYVADALIAQNIPNKYANLEEHSKINIFLQTWKTQTSKLPKDLKNMIEVAKKFGTRLEGLAFPKNITREMPVWYHAEVPETSKSYNQQQNKCLRENHNVRTVGNMEHEAKKIHTIRHSRRRNCRCTECATARTLNCKSPYKCFSRANEIMKTLPPKWNPTVGTQNEDRTDQNQALGEGIKFDY
ncbi:hypothetical protein F5890DRAFT_1422050 [Lentinula detonsa]|uniref:Reverse transcriptase domain-containing protein n=1 Tax=Lentinula detonsa TaxID=2804962 RepID=A0AA38PNP6_9AGAR|nr:hypothetical protein F5890DRAFT_1422050 [Lentinula detonsa]